MPTSSAPRYIGGGGPQGRSGYRSTKMSPNSSSSSSSTNSNTISNGGLDPNNPFPPGSFPPGFPQSLNGLSKSLLKGKGKMSPSAYSSALSSLPSAHSSCCSKCGNGHGHGHGGGHSSNGGNGNGTNGDGSYDGNHDSGFNLTFSPTNPPSNSYTSTSPISHSSTSQNHNQIYGLPIQNGSSSSTTTTTNNHSQDPSHQQQQQQDSYHPPPPHHSYHSYKSAPPFSLSPDCILYSNPGAYLKERTGCFCSNVGEEKGREIDEVYGILKRLLIDRLKYHDLPITFWEEVQEQERTLVPELLRDALVDHHQNQNQIQNGRTGPNYSTSTSTSSGTGSGGSLKNRRKQSGLSSGRLNDWPDSECRFELREELSSLVRSLGKELLFDSTAPIILEDLAFLASTHGYSPGNHGPPCGCILSVCFPCLRLLVSRLVPVPPPSSTSASASRTRARTRADKSKDEHGLSNPNTITSSNPMSISGFQAPLIRPPPDFSFLLYSARALAAQGVLSSDTTKDYISSKNVKALNTRYDWEEALQEAQRRTGDELWRIAGEMDTDRILREFWSGLEDLDDESFYKSLVGLYEDEFDFESEGYRPQRDFDKIEACLGSMIRLTSWADVKARTERAEREKSKGNIAFGKGLYKRAVKHFTAAVDADPENAVYPLNRAAALLKLERYTLAEIDCTTCVGFNARNSKALFRRAMARKGLGALVDAEEDLKLVLSLEPNLKSAIDALEEILETLSKTAGSSSAIAYASRIRIPTIVDSPTAQSERAESQTYWEERFASSVGTISSLHRGKTGRPCAWFNQDPAGCHNGSDCLDSHAPDEYSIRVESIERNVCLMHLIGGCDREPGKDGVEPEDACPYSHVTPDLATDDAVRAFQASLAKSNPLLNGKASKDDNVRLALQASLLNSVISNPEDASKGTSVKFGSLLGYSETQLKQAAKSMPSQEKMMQIYEQLGMPPELLSKMSGGAVLNVPATITTTTKITSSNGKSKSKR